jgi:hypothetical protein
MQIIPADFSVLPIAGGMSERVLAIRFDVGPREAVSFYVGSVENAGFRWSSSEAYKLLSADSGR